MKYFMQQKIIFEDVFAEGVKTKNIQVYSKRFIWLIWIDKVGSTESFWTSFNRF